MPHGHGSLRRRTPLSAAACAAWPPREVNTVAAFNIRNKSDAADAEAIWRVVQQPSKPVAVKTETQQAMLALHQTRSQLVKFRTAQINCLRGLLTEYGEVFRKGRPAFKKEFPLALERLSGR